MADRNVWKSPPHCAAWADGMTAKARKANAMDLVMNFGMTEPALPPKLFLHCHDPFCPAAPVVPEQDQYDSPTHADHRLSRTVTHALGSPPAPMLRGAERCQRPIGSLRTARSRTRRSLRPMPSWRPLRLRLSACATSAAATRMRLSRPGLTSASWSPNFPVSKRRSPDTTARATPKRCARSATAPSGMAALARVWTDRLHHPASLSNSSIVTAGAVVKPMPVDFASAAEAAIARALSGRSAIITRSMPPSVAYAAFSSPPCFLNSAFASSERLALMPLSASDEYFPNNR